MAKLEWQFKTFDQLGNRELYRILHLREAIFTLEQQCFYQDIDGQDEKAWHCIGSALDDDHSATYPESILAYIRILPPENNTAAKIGRVLVSKQGRGRGLGVALMQQAITYIQSHWPEAEIKLSAQYHLKKFYSDLGFVTVSEPYDDAGIPHIDMQFKRDSKRGKIP